MSVNNMKYKNSYRVCMYLPVDLENNARDNALNMGMIKGGRGILSEYIQRLIYDDLMLRPEYEPLENIYTNSPEINKINITLDKETQVQAKDRAKELGFIRAGGGNLSSYIKYLINKKSSI